MFCLTVNIYPFLKAFKPTCQYMLCYFLKHYQNFELIHKCVKTHKIDSKENLQYSDVLFFFYWRYSPLWVLAFSVIFFHSALSSHCFLHRLTPIICRSSSMSAIHLFRSLPLVLVPLGFHCNILLGVLLSSIRVT